MEELEDLPQRIQGNGHRADLYQVITTDFKITTLNDEDFNTVICHNTKRLSGPEANAIIIRNNEETDNHLIIRAKSI